MLKLYVCLGALLVRLAGRLAPGRALELRLQRGHDEERLVRDVLDNDSTSK